MTSLYIRWKDEDEWKLVRELMKGEDPMDAFWTAVIDMKKDLARYSNNKDADLMVG